LAARGSAVEFPNGFDATRFAEVGMLERRVGWRLAAMMALVYAVQGSFWPLLAVHLQALGLNGRSRGWIFATLALGSVIGHGSKAGHNSWWPMSTPEQWRREPRR
jgi:hypothetical protein